MFEKKKKRHDFKKNAKEGNEKSREILLMEKIIPQEKERLVDLVIIIVITIIEKKIKLLKQIIKKCIYIYQKVTLNFIKKEQTKRFFFSFLI